MGLICFEKIITDTITLNCIIDSVDNLQEHQGINIFPNPTSGDVTVLFSQPTIKGMLLQVTNLTGRLLLEKTLDIGQKEQSLKANNLPQGIYFVLVISNGKLLAAEKVVKQ